jgi:hypothetical protein
MLIYFIQSMVLTSVPQYSKYSRNNDKDSVVRQSVLDKNAVASMVTMTVHTI